MQHGGKLEDFMLGAKKPEAEEEDATVSGITAIGGGNVIVLKMPKGGEPWQEASAI